MNSLSSIQELLTKDVTRKEFLLYLGVFFLMLSGISRLLETISSAQHGFSQHNRQYFGSGPYGGRKS